MPTKNNFVGSGLTLCMLVGIFSCLKTYRRKAQERELAAFDDNRRSVGLLNPVRDKTKARFVENRLKVKPPTSTGK